MDYTINIRGQLLDLSEPQVMGILNATPDSFYAASRMQTEEEIARRAHQIVDEGGTIIDIGACSTRPNSTPVDEQEEMARLRLAITVVRRELPDAIISVDTFRPNVTRMAVEELGADIINDVNIGEHASQRAGNTRDTGTLGSVPPYPAPQDDMVHTVARLGVPYILMSVEPTLHDVLLDFARRVQLLRDLGHKDIILDPGFGFGKTVDQNYDLLFQLERLHVMDLPVLVGLSRKSMIWKRLNCRPEDALNGTTALHAIALMKGASILRVHDVKEAVECITLIKT